MEKGKAKFRIIRNLSYEICKSCDERFVVMSVATDTADWSEEDFKSDYIDKIGGAMFCPQCGAKMVLEDKMNKKELREIMYRIDEEIKTDPEIRKRIDEMYEELSSLTREDLDKIINI